MRHIAILFLQRFARLSGWLLLGGLLVAAPIVAFQLQQFLGLFSIAVGFSIAGFCGISLCAIIAAFLRCNSCGKRALVAFSDGENTFAIFDTRQCHHCGAKL
jgi:hypothetical protein